VAIDSLVTSLQPQPVEEPAQALYNQQIADKYNLLVKQLTEIPSGLDTAGIINYLQELKI